MAEHRHRMGPLNAYKLMLEQQTNASQPSYTSKEQQHHHSKLVAASWSALAAATRGRSDISSSISSSTSSSSVITKAIETRNVVERLRLVMTLDSQVPSGREDNGVVIVEGLKENTFQ